MIPSPRTLPAALLSAALLTLAAAPVARSARIDAAGLADLTDGAGGTVTGSGNYLNGSDAYGAANAFDNAYGNDTSRVIFSSASGWVAYAFPEATVVDAFTVRVPTWNVATRSPKRFALSASNDGGATWTLLDEEADQTGWAAQEVRAYGFDNQAAYLAYRFEVLEDNGEGKAQFSELQLCRASDVHMTEFVWQPEGLARASWTNDAAWVGAADLSASVPHWPTSEATVSFARVSTPEVVVEVAGSRGCKGFDFSGTAGLTNLVFLGTGADPKLWVTATGAPVWRWPSDGVEVVFDGLQIKWNAGNPASADATGTLVFRNGAFVDAYHHRWSFGAVGTKFALRVEGGATVELAAFGLSAGSTAVVDDAAFYPRALNLTWQGQSVPGSLRLRGAAPLLAAERLNASTAGTEAPVVFEVPEAGWAGAPIRQVGAVHAGYARELVEPLSNGDGTLRFSVDPGCGFYVGARHPATVPIALWESGIRTDRIVLERLRNGSSWRWGYGEGGSLAEPAAPDDLPTALWADLIPNNRPTVIIVR